jgi:hypothetical protein
MSQACQGSGQIDRTDEDPCDTSDFNCASMTSRLRTGGTTTVLSGTALLSDAPSCRDNEHLHVSLEPRSTLSKHSEHPLRTPA